MGGKRQKRTYREILEKGKHFGDGDSSNDGSVQRLPDVPASFQGSRGGFHMSQMSFEERGHDVERGQI